MPDSEEEAGERLQGRRAGEEGTKNQTRIAPRTHVEDAAHYSRTTAEECRLDLVAEVERN